MSREDIKRTIDFILDQQAQFATNIQLLRETQTQLAISQAKAEVRMDRIEEVVLRTVGVVERLADGLDRTEGLVAAIAEAQAHTEAAIAEAQAHTEASIRELAGAHARGEASITGLAEAQARTEAAMAEAQAHTEAAMADAQAHTEAAIRELAGAQARTEASIRGLAEAQARTEASIRELAGAQARLAGGQEHTDERLNTLINVVERYISKGTEGDSA